MRQTNTEFNLLSSSKHHIICWSGGKDSTATILLLHEHEKELLSFGDKVSILFSEVMFDKKNNISGHNPDIIAFIYEKMSIFQSWGYEVHVLRSDMDYLDVFYHKLSRSPNPGRVGLTHGFIRAGICSVKRDCKLRPVEQWHKEHATENYVDYIGIAIDEPERLKSLHKLENTESLLERYGYTEKDAMMLCQKCGMVSPQYFMPDVKRDGCWFCPHAKLCEHEAIKMKHPAAWEKYVSLEDEPDLAYPRWNVYSKETLHERDERLKHPHRQLTILDFVKF